MQTPEDHSRRSQSFLSLSRQFQQVATDYDILDGTVQELQKANQWLDEQALRFAQTHNRPIVLRLLIAQEKPQQMFKDAFERYPQQVKLLRTYNNLYMTRTQIGVSESFALANQRDSEVRLSRVALFWARPDCPRSR